MQPVMNSISSAGYLKTVFTGIMDIFNGDTSKGADKLMDFFPVLTVQSIIDGINSIKTAFQGLNSRRNPS